MNINDYILNLDMTQNDLFKSLNSFTAQQLTSKENEEWCILEIIEHILITEKTILHIIRNSSSELSPTDELIGGQKIHHNLITLQNQKIPTLESLKPRGEIQDLNTFEKLFSTHRKIFTDDLRKGKISIDNRIFKHPYLGKMTVVDWLNFLLYHTQRHLNQIKVLLTNNIKYMLIIHEVADYKAWEIIFDNAAQIRKEAGEISYQVLSFESDANKVVHFSKWISHEAAKAFFESPKLVQIRKEAGVKSPEFIYLNELKNGVL
jgi:quinol monooxygenase YgiN